MEQLHSNSKAHSTGALLFWLGAGARRGGSLLAPSSLLRIVLQEVYDVLHGKPDMHTAYLERLGATEISVSEWNSDTEALGPTRLIKYRIKVDLPAITKTILRTPRPAPHCSAVSIPHAG